MPEERGFPHTFAHNWPDHILAVWMALREAGVPEANIRLLPVVGPASLPEISVEPGLNALSGPGVEFLASPHGEASDERQGDPRQWYPRLLVNVGSQQLVQLVSGEEPDSLKPAPLTIGRLAHFCPPTLAGVPDEPEDAKPLPNGGADRPQQPAARPGFDTNAQPMDCLVSELKARFDKELTPSLSAELCAELDDIADQIVKTLSCMPAERPTLFNGLVKMTMRNPNRESCARAFRQFSDDLRYWDTRVPLASRQQAVDDFQQWPDLLFVSATLQNQERLRNFLDELQTSEQRRTLQLRLIAAWQQILAWETEAACEACIRELAEILTTESFKAAAMSDMLWGISYIHGQASDLSPVKIGAFPLPARRDGRDDAPPDLDGPVFTTTGGCDSRSLLALLLMRWAEKGPVLGVGPSSHGKPPPRDIAALDLSVLSEVEQHDLWNLVAWKREAADPLVLLELAARRFLHPDAHLSVRRYEPVTARFGSLLGQLSRTVRQSPAPAGIDAPATAQPEGEEVDGADAGSDAPAPAQPDEEQVGGTAVLGGGLLTHPRVVLLVPLDYYGDEDAQRYEKIIAILRRLFLPVHLALEVIWQNKRAALDGATYLNHPMQKARMRTERMKDEE